MTRPPANGILEQGYSEQLKGMFVTLVDNVIADGEETAGERFRRGYALLKKSLILAERLTCEEDKANP